MESKIGLIAGKGDLPEMIIDHCVNIGREIYVISITDEPPQSIIKVPHSNMSVAAVGKAIRTLRSENITDIVFAGGVLRPRLSSLRPDATGLKLLARISMSQYNGDNALLALIVTFFEEKGFNVLGAETILHDLLFPEGVLGDVEPSGAASNDIKTGIDIARSVGNLDIGQSVVVQDGVVIGVEAVEGTDELIKRCGKLQQDGPGGVLVKAKKPIQDSRVDMPTIGVTTVENAHYAGLQGIAVEAGATLVLDKESVINRADELGLFVVGV